MAALSGFFALSLLCLSSFTSIQATNGGFSVKLIPSDSPKSPFYNPSETPYQRINNALRRSVNRVPHFHASNSISLPQAVESEVYANRGEYLMNISIGSPPFEILAVADTGSDLIWTQCKPCEDCYAQEAPLFDQASSSTYKDLACASKACQSLPSKTCGNATCLYSYSYGDGSHTNGNLATETITLGSTDGRPVTFPRFVFGCGHDNGGTFSEKGSGIIGLGGGPLSLISQLGSSIDGKFSYCLVPFFFESGNSSTLNFGSNAVLRGPEVQTTPLVSKDSDTFYYLTLESFSVGTQKIGFGGSGPSEGNIIIDSGTTLTLIPFDVFSDLSNAVDQAAGGKRVDDPSGFLSLCYTSDSVTEFPAITAHFSDGANVELPGSSNFVPVAEGVVCFAFRGIDTSGDLPSIFGNLAQANIMVGYDLQGRTVSFKPTDCTKV